MKDEAKTKKQLIEDLAALRDLRTEEAIEHYYDIGTAVNALLRLSLEDSSLEELLRGALDIILSVPSLSIETKGSIFLVEDEPEVLIQKVQKGLAEPLLKECARVPFGKCLCGRAASIKRIEFADHIDERHEVSYEGMAPHGHYCVPILLSENTIGVINLYLKAGHSRVGREEEFLDSVANTLAGIIMRKRAEEKLKGKDKFLESMVQSSAVATFVVDAEHKIIYWNKACEDLTGVKSEDLRGTSDHWKPFYDHPRPCVADVIIDNNFDEMTNLYKVYARSILIPDGIHAEGWYPNLGGKNRYIVFDAAPIRDNNGKITAAIETLQDITKRKQAEDALQEGQRQLKAILAAVPEIIVEVDNNKVYTWANSVGIEFFGEDVIGKEADFYFEGEQDTYDTVRPLFNGAEDIIYLESWQRRRDGEKRLLAWWCRVLKGDDGNVTGALSSARDITDRKRAEEALSASEEKHRILFESSNDAIMTLAPPSWSFTTGNPATVRMFGACDEAAFTALGPWELSPEFQPDGRPSSEKAAEMIQAAMAKGSHFFEWTHKRLGGDSFPVTVLLTRMEISGQALLQASVRDITEQVQARKQLQDILESLRKAFGVTIQVMISAIEVRDPYTAGHQTRSADLARAIATEMGLSQEKIEAIRMAGPIHDIGKLSVPAEILSKPTKLTNIEFSLIKEHVQTGYEMLKDVESPWPLAQIVYQHHERMDGSGYPRNLKGDEILMEARIMAIADVVESMASHRPYRPALGLNAALEEIEINKGTLYDADAVAACLRLFREKGFQLEGHDFKR
jgi:PAS domain S-box-containing protein/putative nucleotidyltransferase with HDIG domain